MKKLNEMTKNERDEIVLLFANWLKDYSQVVVQVIEKRDEIINNEFTMNLMRELKAREETEEKDYNNSIARLLMCFDGFKEYDVHNHPITHANSYRDILYDMYII